MKLGLLLNININLMSITKALKVTFVAYIVFRHFGFGMVLIVLWVRKMKQADFDENADDEETNMMTDKNFHCRILGRLSL